MAADEQQPQHVVAIVRRRRAARRAAASASSRSEISSSSGSASLLAPAPRLVEREVAADHDQPGGRIARRAVLRPVLQRAQARFLEGLLGRYRGRGNSAAARRAPAGAPRSAPRRSRPMIGHFAPSPGLNMRIGRISRRRRCRRDPARVRPRSPPRASRNRPRRSRAVAPWSRRTARRGRRGSRPDADRGRRGRRHQTGDRAELALPRPASAVDDRALRHYRVVLLLGPGTDDGFVVVAEDGIEHRRPFFSPPRTNDYARSRHRGRSRSGRRTNDGSGVTFRAARLLAVLLSCATGVGGFRGHVRRHLTDAVPVMVANP